MEVDMDLTKAILLQIQAIPHGESLRAKQIVGQQNMKEEDVLEYIRSMKEANYIDAQIIMGQTPQGVPTVEYCTVYRLLNDGHQFLHAVKNKSAVERGQKFLASSTRFLSAEILRDLLRAGLDNLV